MRIFLITLLFGSISFQLAAQKIQGYSIALQSEAIGLPFSNYLPIHPGLEVGVTLARNDKERSERALNVYLGGYYHRRLQTGFYLRGEYLHSLKIGKNLLLDLPMGIGYLHTFYPGEVYQQEEDGSFQKMTQAGRPHALVNLGLGLRLDTQGDWQPFIRQEMGVETPFVNTFPFIIHSFVKVGITKKL